MPVSIAVPYTQLFVFVFGGSHLMASADSCLLALINVQWRIYTILDAIDN